jgi:hypothetical protein
MGHLRWWRPGRAPTMIGSVGRKSPWGHGWCWVLGVLLVLHWSVVHVGEEDERQSSYGNCAFSFLLLQI